MKRIRWDIEEVVAIVDIYFRNSAGEIENLNAELLKLSQALNVRADCLHIKHDDKFRNLNGMQCIFENIRYVVTDGEAGLSNANKLHYTVVDFIIMNVKNLIQYLWNFGKNILNFFA